VNTDITIGQAIDEEVYVLEQYGHMLNGLVATVIGNAKHLPPDLVTYAEQLRKEKERLEATRRNAYRTEVRSVRSSL